MAEVGPDLEAEAKPSKWSKLKEKVKGGSKKAARVALVAARVAIGPGDEAGAAVLSAMPTPTPQQPENAVVIRESLPPNQWKLVPREEKKVAAASGGGDGSESNLNRQARRGQKFQRGTTSTASNPAKIEASVPLQTNRPATTPLRR